MGFRGIFATLALLTIASLPPAQASAADSIGGFVVGARAQGGRNATITTSANAPLLTGSLNTRPNALLGFQSPFVGGLPFHSSGILPSPQGAVIPATDTQFADTRPQVENVYCYAVGVVAGNPSSIVANSDVL